MWRERLRVAIDRTNKKHSWIARQAGIAPATLSRILTATAIRGPSFDVIVSVARVCEVPVGWLLDEPVRGIDLTTDERQTLRAAGELLVEVLDRKTGDAP
ncbi:MAG TPA: helix-turn-helix transcriptional regulator [Thermoanaerobaculia bacterium]|nr:helix-turn-helix transcriptional regulator [Thermoanaerobaculia bacterium]